MILMACHVCIAAKGLDYVCFSIVVHNYRLRDIALSRDAIIRGFDNSQFAIWN